jgi:hypothetical protein
MVDAHECARSRTRPLSNQVLRARSSPRCCNSTCSLRAPQSGYCCRSSTTRPSTSIAVRSGLLAGRRLRSAIPAMPASRYRDNHKYPVGRVIPNSLHRAVNDRSPLHAVTTKLTRCSRTSIVFHGIESYAPALAALARECKRCPETFCKGCHETEQKPLNVGQPSYEGVSRKTKVGPAPTQLSLVSLSHARGTLHRLSPGFSPSLVDLDNSYCKEAQDHRPEV